MKKPTQYKDILFRISALTLGGEGTFTAYSAAKMMGVAVTTARRWIDQWTEQEFLNVMFVEHRPDVYKKVYFASKKAHEHYEFMTGYKMGEIPF